MNNHAGTLRRSHLQMSLGDSNAFGSNQIKAAIQSSRKGKSWLRCTPVGVGGIAGQTVMPNDEFVSLVDTNDEWISKRTGIRKRRLIREGSSLRDLAKHAALNALANSDAKAEDIDLVIVATSSPDDLFGDAAAVAHAIGATKAAAFDLTAACSGFLYGLVTGSQFIESGAYKKVLVIGADALTRFIDWEDRGTCILFGDGAGAMVLEAVDQPQQSGLLGFALRSDGAGSCTLQVPFKSDFRALKNDAKTMVDQGVYGKMLMNGPDVYKFAVSEVSTTATAVCQSTQEHTELFCLPHAFSSRNFEATLISSCCAGASGGGRGPAECWLEEQRRRLAAAAPGKRPHHGARQQGAGHPHGQGAAQHRRVWQHLCRCVSRQST